MAQTIKDKDCRFITGLSDSESEDDDDVIGLVDVMKTFDKAELIRTVHDQISHCFENLAEADATMKEAFIDASRLVHVLPKKGLALLLEAMATGSIVVQDTKAFNVLQEAEIHRRIRDEIKAGESKRCAIDLQLEKWKNCMLPSWKHSIFYHSSKCIKIGKVAVVITVYVRFTLEEKPREVPLVTVGKQFPIGQQNARKVVTGKLHDTEGVWVKNIFKKTRRAYPNDPIDWDAELVNATNITEEEVVYEFYHKEGENAKLSMVGKPIKTRDLKAVSGLLEQTLNFLRLSDDTTLKLRVMFN